MTRYSLSNEELGLYWEYSTKCKAVRLAKYLNKNMLRGPLSDNDIWIVRRIKTGEIVPLKG